MTQPQDFSDLLDQAENIRMYTSIKLQKELEEAGIFVPIKYYAYSVPKVHYPRACNRGGDTIS